MRKIIFIIIIVFLIIIGGLFFLIKKDNEENIQYKLIVEQRVCDAMGENEICDSKYEFSCIELKSEPCLNSGGMFNSADGSCNVNYGFTNCNNLAQKICETSRGSFDKNTKTCYWNYYEGMFDNLQGNVIYNYPLVNVGGHIEKKN